METTLNLQYPIKAADFLGQHKLTDRVLSDTLEASYLIYRGIPVFVDGRMDLYRDQFYFEWYLASRAAAWVGNSHQEAPTKGHVIAQGHGNPAGCFSQRRMEAGI